MTTRWKTLAVAALGLAVALPAAAQQQPRNQVTFMREIDSDRYDPHRTTAQSGAEVLTMLSDTLVSMDYDMRTIRPGLAERWEVSPDQRTYTFHLRRDVTFCDGKPMTADDVVYSINRWIGRTTPRVASPGAWRAGDVKEVRAVDPYTVEYELNEPYGELLSQLSQYFGSIVDRATVERLGDNFGVQGFNGTGPYCWVSWTPRSEIVLQRHPTYHWGPPVLQNAGPAHVERIVWRVIPEAAARVAALQAGQADISQYIPDVFWDALRRVPTIRVSNQPNYFWDVFMGFKVDRPVVSDVAIRRAAHMAVDRVGLVRAVWSGHAQPARNIVNPNALDYDAQSDAMVPNYDPAAARRLLDEAGWRVGPDGVRVKDGQRATFLMYAINNLNNQRAAEIIQQGLRQVGIEMRVQMFDATVAWGRLGTQEFDAYLMGYPYTSTTDALSLYWPSGNRPTPNRSNWNDPETDAWLLEARRGLTPEARAQATANIQRRLAEQAPWLTLARNEFALFSTTRVEGVRAHALYGVGIYRGLDLRVVR